MKEATDAPGQDSAPVGMDETDETLLWMDEIHFAPPKKPWNDDSPVNTNKQWFPMVSKWCRILSMHSMNTGMNHLPAGAGSASTE